MVFGIVGAWRAELARNCRSGCASAIRCSVYLIWPIHVLKETFAPGDLEDGLGNAAIIIIDAVVPDQVVVVGHRPHAFLCGTHVCHRVLLRR
jgi:hypothetical protein